MNIEKIIENVKTQLLEKGQSKIFVESEFVSIYIMNEIRRIVNRREKGSGQSSDSIIAKQRMKKLAYIDREQNKAKNIKLGIVERQKKMIDLSNATKVLDKQISDLKKKASKETLTDKSSEIKSKIYKKENQSKELKKRINKEKDNIRIRTRNYNKSKEKVVDLVTKFKSWWSKASKTKRGLVVGGALSTIAGAIALSKKDKI